MGQEICCQVSKQKNNEIVSEVMEGFPDEANDQDYASLSELEEKTKIPKNQNDKKKRVQSFYGAKDCSITKTITKQINLPGLSEKLLKINNVIEECEQQLSIESLTNSKVTQIATTNQLISEASKIEFKKMEKKIVNQI